MRAPEAALLAEVEALRAEVAKLSSIVRVMNDLPADVRAFVGGL